MRTLKAEVEKDFHVGGVNQKVRKQDEIRGRHHLPIESILSF